MDRGYTYPKILGASRIPYGTPARLTEPPGLYGANVGLGDRLPSSLLGQPRVKILLV